MSQEEAYNWDVARGTTYLRLDGDAIRRSDRRRLIPCRPLRRGEIDPNDLAYVPCRASSGTRVNQYFSNGYATFVSFPEFYCAF